MVTQDHHQPNHQTEQPDVSLLHFMNPPKPAAVVSTGVVVDGVGSLHVTRDLQGLLFVIQSLSDGP